MFKKIIDGKPVIVKANSKNIPPFKVIKDTYAKIPDNKRIPIVFETKEQYLDEYIKNQEKAKGIKFSDAQKRQYKHSELHNMSNIISRYTTNHNPFIDRRTVFFNDHKIPVKQFQDSALHEYGHELWEKSPKIRKDWKSVSRNTSPTSYGATSKQEDFAESFMLAKTGRLQDQRRGRILSDVAAKNNVKVMPWHGNIEQQSIQNPNFRKIAFTGNHAQISLMSIKPGQDVGLEKHNKVDQFFRIEQGKAQFNLNKGKEKFVLGNGGAAMIPAGTWHNIINKTPGKALKLYTIYSPSNHPPGTIQRDKPSKDDLGEELGYTGNVASKEFIIYGTNKKYNPTFEINELGAKVNLMAKDTIGSPEKTNSMSTQGFNIQGFGGIIKETPTTDRTSWNLKKKLIFDSNSNNMAKVYHGTTKLKAFFITKEGLKTSKDLDKTYNTKEADSKMSDHTDPNHTYFFEKPEHARAWAKVVGQDVGLPPAIIEADIPDKELKLDLNMPYGKAFKKKGGVPANKLKIYDDDESKDYHKDFVNHSITEKRKSEIVNQMLYGDITSNNMAWAKGLDGEYAEGEGISFATGRTDKKTGEYTNTAYDKKRVLMSPDEVLHRQFEQKPSFNTATNNSYDEKFEKWKNFADSDTINKLKKAITDPKEKVPVVIEEYDETGKRKPFQEGRHRAIAAMELGHKTMPVIIALKKPDRDYPEYSKKKVSNNTEWDITAGYPEDDGVSYNMPFVKKTTVPNVDYPNEYDSYTEKRTVKMSPDKFLESTKLEAAQSETQRGHPRNALQLMSMPVKDYAEGSWWPAEKDFDREGTALRHGWKQTSRVERVKKGLKEGKNIPGLYLTEDATGRTVGHEGRHRAVAAMELGIGEVPVHIMKERPGRGYIEPKNRNVRIVDTIPGEYEGEPSSPFADNTSKNFSLLDPELIERLAPEVVPRAFSWRTD